MREDIDFLISNRKNLEKININIEDYFNTNITTISKINDKPVEETVKLKPKVDGIDTSIFLD